jgi:antimicrobial peptide system SdpB family protein
MSQHWLIRYGTQIQNWASPNPFTNVYGLARTLLALSTAATLLCTPTAGLFLNPFTLRVEPFCYGIAKGSLFCLPSNHLSWDKVVGVVILLIVASGWRPRITGVFHWWVAFSFQISAASIDGGDQLAAIITLFLLPVCLADTRKWHWQEPAVSTANIWTQASAWFAIIAIRVQVAGVYFHSSIAKLSVPEWADGTAVYYWFTNPTFGAPLWRRSMLMPLLRNQYSVSLITWGSILFEIVLFMALVMPKPVWRYLLPLGIAFHVAIALIHGLISFSTIMCGALILYLRPCEQPFHGVASAWFRLHAWLARGPSRLGGQGASRAFLERPHPPAKGPDVTMPEVLRTRRSFEGS